MSVSRKTVVGFLSAAVLAMLLLLSVSSARAAAFGQDENGDFIKLDNAAGGSPVAVPDGVYSFRVYDSGNSSQNQSGSAYHRWACLTLQVPENRMFDIRGSIEAGNRDIIYLYDSITDTSADLLGTYSGSDSIGPVHTTGEYLTIVYEDTGNPTPGAFELNIRVFNINHPYDIYIQYAEHGRVTCERKKSDVWRNRVAECNA